MHGENCEKNLKSEHNIPARGMKWFKYQIYFSLPVGALHIIFIGILHIVGALYDLPEFIFAYIHSPHVELKSLDVAYGLTCFILAAYGIHIAISLSKFKRKGPEHLHQELIISIALSLIYEVTASIILGESMFDFSVILTTIAEIILLIIDIKYFHNRKDLFVN